MELKHLLKELENFLNEDGREFTWNQDSENSLVITWKQ